MKYSDGRIGLFNDVGIDVGNFSVDVVMENTMAPRTVIDYDLNFDVGDTKQIFVMGDDFEDSYNKFKALKRDLKIDSIINE